MNENDASSKLHLLGHAARATMAACWFHFQTNVKSENIYQR